MSKQVDRGLIVKYLNNACSPQERILVEQFLQQPESEELLNEILTERSLQDWAQFRQDDTRSEKLPSWLQSIHQRIDESSFSPEIPASKPFYLRYAAVWIAFMMIAGAYSIWQYKKNQAEAVSYFVSNNPNGKRSVITLSDSSVIYLGAGSKLNYPDKFVGDTREVSLSGEAFFEITKNPQKPFIIHTGNITTKVLGTSFKIEAFKKLPLSVEVATGKVRVDQHLANHSIRSLAILTPGQKVIWNNDRAEIGEVAVDAVRMWKDSKLAFNNQSLRDIADELERWYNLKIVFKDHVKAEERMTVTLNAGVSADKIFNVLANAAKFKYTIKNNLVTIN